MRNSLVAGGVVLATLVLTAACGGGSSAPTQSAPAGGPPAEQTAPAVEQQPMAGMPAPTPDRGLVPLPDSREAVAPPIGEDAQMPPGHPPIGAPAEPAGTAQMPPGHPPIEAMGQSPGQIQSPPPGSGVGATGMQWTLPAGWIDVPPSSSVRKAQFRVPGPSGDAECVVFYFGPGQGGDPQSNAERWASQFSTPDGQPAVANLKTSRQTVGSLDVLRVEVGGRYANPMTSDPPIADALLLGAIAEGKDANWFFKLTGPRATVESQRTAFDDFVRSLKAGA